MSPLACLVGLLLTAQAPDASGDAALDEALLREHHLPVRGPELLDFFRQRIPTPEVIVQFRLAYGQLSSPVYAERARASADLLRLSHAVRPLLLRALEQPPADRETLRRAQHCLGQLPGELEWLLVPAAARQVMRTRPEGALAVLLDYVPYVPTEAVRQEVQIALQGVSTGEDMTRLLRRALDDPQPFKRAAAGEALIRADPGERAVVLPLLHDPHPQVRFQLARALTERAEDAGVPVLIELLGEFSGERAEVVLDLLVRIAGEDAPPPAAPGTEVHAVRDAWRRWYGDHGQKVDLASRMRLRELGYTVLTYAGIGLNGQVVEIDAIGKVRWQFGGVRYPVDAQVFGPDRVLLAEYLGRRVTERDFRGNVLWEKAVNMPIACQRLSGGQTFIATRQQLLVVDHDGKETFTWTCPMSNIAAARRLRDGQMVIVTTAGTCRVIDPRGREVKSFHVGQVYSIGGQIDALPSGRVLVPLYGENRVAEFDLTGQVRWQARVAAPTSVSRLANGNTLVVSLRDQRAIELNSDGAEVWSYHTDGRPWRARRR